MQCKLEKEQMQISEAQLQAIRHFTGPAMVLAGPGSGKTTVITQRVRNLIEERGVNPGRILTITFSKAAAMEMESRFRMMTGEKYRTNFGTFHGVFFRMLRCAYRYDASNIIREDERLTVLRRIVAALGSNEQEKDEYTEEIQNEISLVKNDRLKINSYYAKSCPADLFRRIYREYESALRQAGKIDFDDMLLLTWELLSERPDILKGWQERYPFLLVDEFQDINRVQYDIVRLLAGKERSLFIVGDDDQSIYRFRGARPEIMLGFEKDFPGTKRYLLGINYRSTETIVRAAGKVIRNNEHRFQKEISAVREKGDKLVLSRCKDQKEQAARVLDKISRYRRAGYTYRDMAILYRTNLNASVLMEQLMYHNVPMQTREGIPNLFEHWIAKDLISYLRLSLGDRTRATFYAVMNRPNRYIGRDSVPSAVFSWDELRKFYRDRDWMTERIDRLEFDLKNMAQMKPAAAIHYLRQTVGYDRFLEEYAVRQHVKPEDWLEVLDALEESAVGFETAEDWFYSIEEYTKRWKEQAAKRRMYGKEDAKTDQSDCVTLATMHSAKGLEFPIVFVISANEGITPHRKAKKGPELEEERRLFYVAMTRAKNHLHILYLEELYRKPVQISRFVEEIRKP